MERVHPSCHSNPQQRHILALLENMEKLHLLAPTFASRFLPQRFDTHAMCSLHIVNAHATRSRIYTISSVFSHTIKDIIIAF